MKKILFLLLLSVSLYGQNPTPFTKVKITGNTTSTTATKVNVQETNGEINTIAKADLIDYLEYATASALPVTGVDAKIYLTKDDNKLYRWNGTVYTLLSGSDASGKEDSANKQNSLTTDGSGVKFPTVDAVNTGLALKVDKNTAITGSTNTKITYDAKGLITSGTSLSAGDIPNIAESQVTNLTTDLAAKQATLVSATNIKTINGVSILGSGDMTVASGGGDMVLASAQTNTGTKTFLNGSFGLRNVANTFTSVFSNANTAARTYTLQNRDGTLLDNTDLSTINTSISGRMANPAGTASYLPKFLTATTIGNSRLWDTGTFFGIGTAITPTKDITLGNQDNREIGIEESSNTVVGRNLILKAGRTINYVPNTNFNDINQTVRGWRAITGAPNGNVYAIAGGVIYMQTAGAGDFIDIGQTVRTWLGITAAPNGNVYATIGTGDIYMQTAGVGNFVALGQVTRSWSGIGAAPNGNVYAIAGGDIYMQTGGVGAFVALGQTSRPWFDITVAPNGNAYACIGAGNQSGDIYMQTGGVGNFVALGQPNQVRLGIEAAPNGNVYACGDDGSGITMQTAGVGNFVSLGQGALPWYGLAAMPNGNVYATLYVSGKITMQNNDTFGSPNLDGGTLKHFAGTGKGTGSSTQEFYTGQKTSSGTDMQTETLRMKIDNEGKTSFYGIINLKGYTVSTLPTGVVGDTAYVTDATSPTFLSTVVGGGSVKCRVFFNGTNWIVN